MTKAEFLKLPTVRVTSSAGPCLTHYRMVRRNKTTVTVACENGDGISTRKVYAFQVHFEPCPCCTDHPRTSYPHGYMD